MYISVNHNNSIPSTLCWVTKRNGRLVDCVEGRIVARILWACIEWHTGLPSQSSSLVQQFCFSKMKCFIQIDLYSIGSYHLDIGLHIAMYAVTWVSIFLKETLHYFWNWIIIDRKFHFKPQRLSISVTSHGLSCEVCKCKAHKRCAAKAIANWWV